MTLIDRLQATIQKKVELFRLEQRYTRRRNRRSTFHTNAVYVDGEYVYQTPNSTGSSSSTTAASPSDSGRVDALHNAEPANIAPVASPTTSTKQKRLSRRISSIASFGGSKTQNSSAHGNDWRTNRVSVAEVQR